MQFQFTFYLVIPKFVRNFRSTFLIWEVGRELRNELHNEFTKSSQQTSYKHSYMLEFRLLFVVCVLIRTFSIAARKNRKFAFGNDKPKLLLNTYLWLSTFYPWPSTFHPRLFTLDPRHLTLDLRPKSRLHVGSQSTGSPNLLAFCYNLFWVMTLFLCFRVLIYILRIKMSYSIIGVLHMRMIY